VRQLALFAATTAAIIAVVALLLYQGFGGADNHHAVAVSAGVAFVVQVVAFGMTWRLRRWNVMGAWGLGVGIRFIALGLYALIGVRAWGLAPVPALLAMVIFLFLSTLAEPWLLRSPAPSR
jgi:hypothetical protein